MPWSDVPGLRVRTLMAGRNIIRKRRHGPVVRDPLQIHPQFLHLGETFGGDEVTTLAFHEIFFHPPQFFGGLNEHVAQGKGIDWSNAVLLRLFGFHAAPFRGYGKSSLPKLPCLYFFQNAVISARRKSQAGISFGFASCRFTGICIVLASEVRSKRG